MDARSRYTGSAEARVAFEPMPPEVSIAVQEAFRLGPWRIDPGSCEISSDSGTAHLEPRAMAVLCYLAARAQQTVSRDELLDALWKTRYVVDDALTRSISQLRQHLDDDPRNPRFIQTVPKVGYRLLVAPQPLDAGAVPEAPSAPPPPPPAAATTTRSGRYLAIGALALVLLITFAWWRSNVQRAAEREPSIAILPFIVLGDSPDTQVFADGMTEDLIQLLATVPDMRVASRTSSYYFKDKQVDAPTIARTLGVAFLLEGSMRRAGDRIIVKAQLIDAATDQHVWSQEFDRELLEVFELQEEITVALAQRLDLTIGDRRPKRSPATRDMAAYQLFVEGRMALGTYEEAAARNSISFLEAAVKLDPQFASAWAALAVARWVSPASLQMSPEAIAASDEAARAAAQRALEINSSLPNAQFVLADSARVSYAFIDAERRYLDALSQTPGDTALHIGYGNLMGDVGRIGDSMTRRQLSYRRDPLSPICAFFLARGHVLSGDLVEARRQLERARDLGFRNAVLDHTEAYLEIRARNFPAARAIWARGDTAEARTMLAVIAALEDPARRGDAAALVRDLPAWHVLPYRGRLYAALLLGETDIAWAAADEGVARKLEPTDIWWLPEATAMRKDPRFTALAEGMNLLPYWRQFGWPDQCSGSDAGLRCD
jgi:TolB-like protein/DNA-binding winged helix-turn-helix (wHTH) protein/Tfp pilus assembly protein PilF